MSSILSMIQLVLIFLNLNLHPKLRTYTTLGVIVLAPCIGILMMQNTDHVSLQVAIWVLQIGIVATSSYLWGARKVPRR